ALLDLGAHLVTRDVVEAHLEEGQQRRLLSDRSQRLDARFRLPRPYADAGKDRADRPTQPRVRVDDQHRPRRLRLLHVPPGRGLPPQRSCQRECGNRRLRCRLPYVVDAPGPLARPITSLTDSPPDATPSAAAM